MIDIIEVPSSPARIKVFGVGGGGSNAVSRMIQAGLCGVEFWVANTDLQALENSDCANRLQLGRQVTRGLGAGGDPEIGRLSAEEDRESVGSVLAGTDMLFITAGMGGGTGTGGAPVVAEVARELGILTVAIVTKPFSFEGRKKMSRAQTGLEALGQHVDTLIAIPNQKLLNIVEPGTPFSAAMLVADEVLFQATRGISDLITGHGLINLDFADVRTVMKNRGNALLGCGVGKGKERAIEAAQAAVSSPLLDEVHILGAEAVLVNVHGGPDMGLHEAAEATQFVADRVGDEADVYWGAVIDPSLGEEMRVTLIVTGFSQPARSAPALGSVPASIPSPIPSLVPPPPPGSPPGSLPNPVPVPVSPTAVAPGQTSSATEFDQADDPDNSGRPLSVGSEEMMESSVSARAPFDSAPRSGIDPGLLDPTTEDEALTAARAVWELDPVTESELFLAPESLESARVPSGREVARTGEPRHAQESSRPASGWGSSREAPFSRTESGGDTRLRRHPLDKPAFMRKKLLD